MIEINLLPGSRKRSARGAPGKVASGKSAARLPGIDRTAGMIAAGWIIGLGAIAFLHFGTANRAARLEVELEAAVRDSMRYATLRAQGDSLTSREAIIAQKLEVIQQIDAGRYTWPHILDEVSRALPQFVWLDSVNDIGGENGLPRVQIEGYAGTPFALTRYMEQLEASPFLGGTRLVSTTQTRTDNRTVHVFTLIVQYREPPPDVLQTVPLAAAIVQEN
jgi:Tfp pilus assembly protein PilN